MTKRRIFILPGVVVWLFAFGISCAGAQSIAGLRQEAEAGDASAQFRLGNIYASGQGAPQDYPQALQWFSKAAEQGNIEAMSMLSLMYATGKGVGKDMSTGYFWAAVADRLAPDSQKAEYAKSKREMASWLQVADIGVADARVNDWLKAHHLPK